MVPISFRISAANILAQVQQQGPAHLGAYRSIRRHVVLRASDNELIQQILCDLTDSPTTNAFQDSPLANVSSSTRGNVIALAVRNILSELNPAAKLTDAVTSFCVNGARRGSQTLEYDWQYNSRRVEVKSSQFQWQRKCRRWGFQFQGIKLASGNARPLSAFDDLILALYTPSQIHIYSHDLQLGVSTHGKNTASTGHRITIFAPGDLHEWEIALPHVLKKLDHNSNACKCIADVPLTHSRVADASAQMKCQMKQSAYNQVPLSNQSGTARGLAIQQIVRVVDQIIHPVANIHDAVGSVDVNGRSLNAYNAAYDWLRDGSRVECKSAQLHWDKSRHSWSARFHNVKLGVNGQQDEQAFDELILALHTPRGIFIHRHDLSFGVASNGVNTVTHGYSINVSGPSNEHDWSVALDAILGKFKITGCELLAVILWD